MESETVMARIRTKTGDGYPLDVTGNFLFEGAVVCFAHPHREGDPEYRPLRFGFIKKLGKSFADVVIPAFGDADAERHRYKEPAKSLILVEPDTLSSLVPAFENLKLEAAKARTY